MQEPTDRVRHFSELDSLCHVVIAMLVDSTPWRLKWTVATRCVNATHCKGKAGWMAAVGGISCRHMCRSIKTLRNPEMIVTDEDLEAAALQFVRKISGYRQPSKANETSFRRAVREISRSSRKLMDTLVVKT